MTVRVRVRVSAHVVAEDELVLALEELLLGPGQLELGLDVVGDERAKVLAVVVVDEPVAEDPQRLVAPQAREDLLARDGGGLHHEHALDHLAHVAQVEGVVRLGGDGLEVAQHAEEEVDLVRVRGRVRVRERAGLG